VAIIACVLAAAGAAGLAAAPKLEQSRQKVWMRSGRRYALAALEGRAARSLSGTFTAYCSSRDVRSLAVASDTLWIGTEGGLFAAPLSGGPVAPAGGPASLGVTALAVGDDGALWVGSDYGLSVRSEGRWKHYAKQSNPVFGRIRALVAGESRFWIGSYGGGCGYVVGDGLTVLTRQDSLPDERVLSIAEESPRVMFFGTASGLVMADSLGWKSLRYGARLPIGAVRDIAFDEEESLFLAIAEQGVAVYSFGRVQQFGAADSLPGIEVSSLSLDPTGRMWAAGRAGLSVFSGTDWSLFTPPGKAPHPRARYRSIRHDVDGNCYAGTDAGTVLVVSRDAVKELIVPQTFSEDRVVKIASAGGAVWMLAGRDVYVYRGTFAKQTPPPDLYAGEMTDMIVLDTGEMWATSRFGILHWSGRAWEVFDRRQGLPTEDFVSAARDSQGNLWFRSFDRGVVEYTEGRWIARNEGEAPLGGAPGDLVVDGAGTPWTATAVGTVARFVQGAWEELAVPSFAPARVDTSQRPDSLSRLDSAIRFLPGSGVDQAAPSVEEPCRLGLDGEGALLAATADGVFRLSPAGWQGVEYPTWRKHIEPTAVLGSKRGELWVGSAGEGVLVYRSGAWFALTASTGLSDDYIRSLEEDERGNVWIGTQFGGVTRYTPPNGG